MSKTKRNEERKLERQWQELQNEKLRYVKRKQDEELAERNMRAWKRLEEDDPTEPLF